MREENLSLRAKYNITAMFYDLLNYPWEGIYDASVMHEAESCRYDRVISTFICCVMPADYQPATLRQFGRVLKPGGRFMVLEMIYSQNRNIRRRQEFFTAFVEKVYGARFDRKTLRNIEESDKLEIINKRFLKDDVYLLIEGVKKG